ncbi:MAG: hypothetical protein R6X19_10770 [Kiritimatiellia bacterium]
MPRSIRRVFRRFWQSDRLAWFADRPKWDGLASVCMVESERQIPGKSVTLERLLGHSVSLDGSPAQALLESDPGGHSVFSCVCPAVALNDERKTGNIQCGE